MKISQVKKFALLAILISFGSANSAIASELPKACKLMRSAVKVSCERSAKAKKHGSKRTSARLRKDCQTKAKKFERQCASEVCGALPFFCPDGFVCAQVVQTKTFPSLEALKDANAHLLYAGNCNDELIK